MLYLERTQYDRELYAPPPNSTPLPMRAFLPQQSNSRLSDIFNVLKIKQFAIYQSGHFISNIGFWMLRIVIGWEVWLLSKSEAWLGILAFSELVPSIIMGFIGGAIADRMPIIKFLFLGKILVTSVILTLTFTIFFRIHSIESVIFFMFIIGSISGLILPARLASTSFLVPTGSLSAALAVNSTAFNLSRFIGPALAALILIFFKTFVVLVIVCFTYLLFIYCLWKIRKITSARIGTAENNQSTNIRQVFFTLIRTPLVLAAMLFQLAQGVLLRPASELFPAFSEKVFDSGEVGLGLLNAAVGIGAIMGAILFNSGKTSTTVLTNIFKGSCVFALALIAFSLTSNLYIGLLILSIQGLAMSSSNIAAMTYVQQTVQINQLGRIMSFYSIIYRVGPALGAFLFGVTAEFTNLQVSSFIYGFLGLLTSLFIWKCLAKPNFFAHKNNQL